MSLSRIITFQDLDEDDFEAMIDSDFEEDVSRREDELTSYNIILINGSQIENTYWLHLTRRSLLHYRT